MRAGAGEPAASRRGLRLRAEDAEDLAVVSACLQDALVPVRDLAYDRAAGTFALAANRFCWEGGGAGAPAAFARTVCLVAFEAVAGVAYRGFRRREEERILSLLAVQAVPDRASDQAAGAAGMTIDLEFAGGATIRLAATAIRCRLRDVGEAWPTTRQPGHFLEEQP
jgi:hypothetical protein